MAYETLFINGVDLASLASCVQGIDGLYLTPAQRGSNIVIPGVDGELYVDKPFEAGTVTIQLLLAGNTTTDFNNAYRQLRSIVAPGRRVQMVRQLSLGSGYEQHVAYGEYLSGLEPELQLARFGKIALTMKVLSGTWFSMSSYTVGSGTVMVVGDARTRRITMSMSPGTVSNATTGTSVTYSGSGAATVDVESMSATDATGADVSAYLSWTGLFPMELVPGINLINGTVSMTYRAAYL